MSETELIMAGVLVATEMEMRRKFDLHPLHCDVCPLLVALSAELWVPCRDSFAM